MNVKTIVSAIALSAAMTLSGPAFAQTVVGGVTIAEDDLASVQERCDQIEKAAAPRSLTAEDTEAGDSNDGEATADSAEDENTDAETSTAADADVTGGNVEAVNEAAAATTTSIDLDTLTLEACTDAGLIGM